MTNADKKPRFYICKCFVTDNIFLEDFKLHIRFSSELQFRQDYQAVSFLFTNKSRVKNDVQAVNN